MSQPTIAKSARSAHVQAKLTWVFVLSATTTAVLRAGAQQQIVGVPCQLYEGRSRRAIMIKGAHGLLGYVPADMTEQITAEMEATGRGRLEGEIMHIEGEQVIVRLRYVCVTQK